MPNADDMLAAAAAHPDELAAGELTSRPRRKVAVLSCMDTRIDLYAILGIARGDAHLVRNAGGLVTDDAIRSIAVSQRALGTEEVVVIMHERCGLLGASDDDFAAELEADGAKPSWRLGGFDDIEATLRAGVQKLRESPELSARDEIRGLIFDPASGSLREVA